MKKILSVVLLICLAFSMLVVTTACSGASKGLEFELSEDGTSYIVVGRGSCNDTELVIPKKHEKLPVTAIANEAFKSWTELTSVTIPGSVKTIGDKAFAFCAGITEIKVENGVESIGAEAFRGCSELEAVVLPESTVRIGERAFAYCTSLVDFTLKSTSMTFGDRVFEYNKVIERISFGGTIEEWKTKVQYESEDRATIEWRYTTHIERVHCSDGAYFLD